MITFNMILHVSYIMNEGSERLGDQENNVCRTAKNSFRRSNCVACLGSVYPTTFLPSYVPFIVQQFNTLIILYCTVYS